MKPLRAAAALSVLSLTLAACGGGDDGDSAQAGSIETAAVGEPVTLQVACAAGFEHLRQVGTSPTLGVQRGGEPHHGVRPGEHRARAVRRAALRWLGRRDHERRKPRAPAGSGSGPSGIRQHPFGHLLGPRRRHRLRPAERRGLGEHRAGSRGSPVRRRGPGRRGRGDRHCHVPGRWGGSRVGDLHRHWPPRPRRSRRSKGTRSTRRSCSSRV